VRNRALRALAATLLLEASVAEGVDRGAASVSYQWLGLSSGLRLPAKLDGRIECQVGLGLQFLRQRVINHSHHDPVAN